MSLVKTETIVITPGIPARHGSAASHSCPPPPPNTGGGGGGGSGDGPPAGFCFIVPNQYGGMTEYCT